MRTFPHDVPTTEVAERLRALGQRALGALCILTGAKRVVPIAAELALDVAASEIEGARSRLDGIIGAGPSVDAMRRSLSRASELLRTVRVLEAPPEASDLEVVPGTVPGGAELLALLERAGESLRSGIPNAVLVAEIELALAAYQVER